jgi:hypothetical protein
VLKKNTWLCERGNKGRMEEIMENEALLIFVPRYDYDDKTKGS